MEVAKTTARAMLVCLLGALSIRAADLPGDWSGDYPPCRRHDELLKPGHMRLGIWLATAEPRLSEAFTRALDFWAGILDMEWHEEHSSNCSIQIVTGPARLFRPAELARAQFPGRPAFQGWIALNPAAAVSDEERYLLAVHEVGHLLGLPHNPSARSVMYFLCFEGPPQLDATDLARLAARHKLRAVITVDTRLPSGPKLDRAGAPAAE